MLIIVEFGILRQDMWLEGKCWCGVWGMPNDQKLGGSQGGKKPLGTYRMLLIYNDAVVQLKLSIRFV